MALKRMASEERAATLRIAAPTETDPPHNDWPDRVGALNALTRSELFRRGSRFVAYAFLGGLIGVLLLLATATVPVLFGYHTYNVQGASMEPSLKAGSVAVTAPTSPRALKVGDIVAMNTSNESRPVLHRIIELTEVDGQRLFVTQGDANRTPDPKPAPLEGQGDRVVYSVPYAGYVLDFAGSGLGRVVVIGAPLLLLAATFLRERRPSPQRREEAGTQIGVATERQPVLPPVTFIRPQAVDRDLPAFLVQQQLRYRGVGQRTARQEEKEPLVA